MPSPQVAIIEDNRDNLEIAKIVLRHQVGVQVVGGWASGAMFLKWFHESQQTALNPHLKALDLILLDLQLPRESGHVVLQKLRKEPELAQAKIIAWTANASQAEIEECRQTGFNGFLGKPINMDRFPRQIARILEGDSVWEP